MKLVTLVSILCLLSFNALAGRGGRQHQRIQQGVNSGQLTREEAQKLRQEQRDIRDDKQAAMADGTVTQEEKKQLNQERHEASKHIRHQKHDGQKRGHHGGKNGGQNQGGIVEENDMNIPVGSTTPSN